MTVNPVDSEIFGPLFGTEEMRRLFSDRHRFQLMLDVEVALAQVEARLGIIPAGAADAIAAAAQFDKLDIAALAEGTRLAAVPVAALAKELRRLVGKEAADYVHWGATTQDIVDTALVLQLRDGLDLIEAALRRTARGLARQAEAHRDLPVAGRTYLQQALPVTLGFKCAIWLDPLLRHIERLRQLRPRVLRVQFGGAVGTLASLGDQGRAVTEGLADALGLGVPDAPWHVSRDGLAEAACCLGLLCGSLAKMATDIVLMMQTEVAEVSEPAEEGRGGSSTLPQKRNPVGSAMIIAATRGVEALVPLMLNAMAQDHERATGPWQSEWLALPQIFVLAAGALQQAEGIAAELETDADQMRANLALTRGLINAEAVSMALSEKLGRAAAQQAMQRAGQKVLAEKRPLAEVLAEDPAVAQALDKLALQRLTDPAHYLGEAGAVVDRTIAAARNLFGEA